MTCKYCNHTFTEHQLRAAINVCTSCDFLKQQILNNPNAASRILDENWQTKWGDRAGYRRSINSPWEPKP